MKTALDISRRFMIEENGMPLRPSFPLSHMTPAQQREYLKQKHNLRHGKGKKKKK